MAEYIPNWKGLEAYHFTGSNQAELKTQVEKVGGSTYTDDYGNFYLVIDKTKYFMPPNYVLVINEKRAGKLYKKADFDANYKDYSGGGSGTDITAGEGIKVSASGEVSADFSVIAKKEDLDKNVFVAVYNQTTAQELLDYLATTNRPYAPIIVERGGQYYTAILSFKQNDETAYIRILGSANGEYTIFNHSIKGNVWGTDTTTLQKKIDLNNYYSKTDTDNLLALKADKTEMPDLTNLVSKTELGYTLLNYAHKTELEGYMEYEEGITFLEGKQDKLTAGEGITLENNVISATSTFNPNDHFKLFSVTEDNITIASQGRVNKQLLLQNLPTGFQIVGYKQVSIEKASQETNAEAFHKVYIQTFSTAGGGTKANVSVVNTNTFSTQIKLTITCLVMKIS